MNEENQHPDDWLHEPPVIEPEPTQAVQLREATPPPLVVPTTTPEQAKVDAIANLTMTAYARASELKLTPEEIAGLQKEFPDGAFRPGAAGKENLIYIEHAHLRDRLNQVLGVGQWAIIPRKRWGEDFRTTKNEEACRIYVEAMLMIRGCFVAEAVGDMVYYKNNQSHNYGDSVEGAKTAALRRCAKELGVGLQAWKKDWCEGWWQRKNAAGRSGGSQRPAQPRPTAPSPQSASKPAAKTSDVVPPAAISAEADKDQRFRFLGALSVIRTEATKYFVKKGWLTDKQPLEDLPNKHVPTTKREYDSIMAELQAFMDGDQETDELWWKKVVVPFGAQKDTPIGELGKKKLFGWCKNYEVEEEYNGVRKSDEELDVLHKFREALDAADAHYFNDRQ